MKGFNFEKNLPHQKQAIDSTVAVLRGLDLEEKEATKHQVNPLFNFKMSLKAYHQNLRAIQQENGIYIAPKPNSEVIDIMMETGTGKTYTYTKTMLELNKYYGIFKFVIVVPTLSIKAGTVNFLRSDSSREHFKEQYDKTINLHIVESKKTKTKNTAPPDIVRFVESTYDKNTIEVLLINAGMINSDTMKTIIDSNLFMNGATVFNTIASLNAFMIIDEPHKFGQTNKTWENIKQFKPQCILRYGATFPEVEVEVKNSMGAKEKKTQKDYHNLIYNLTAVTAFNDNLVKGVRGYVTAFDEGKNALVRLISTDGKEATFELVEKTNRKTVKLSIKDSLSRVHEQMTDLYIEKMNKTTVVLSNGMELKRDSKLNPYAYAQTVQESMLRRTIEHHFRIEKELLCRSVRIKPLTLFFIDNIEEYRDKNGYLRKLLEQNIEAHVQKLLLTETDDFYRHYLEQTLADLSKTHGGYFSKDNTEKDETIEKEVNEILHDKEALLSLDNPRRFIFSKWTLREGWDNPNVFQICKMRSSGSEISKLQEVGRGLRLPVNEYGNREKDQQFYLNYFVDFTEEEFIEKLVKEINDNAGAFSLADNLTKLSDSLIKKIIEKYRMTEEELLEELDDKNLINRANDFKTGGYDYIKNTYPLAFEGIGSDKVERSDKAQKTKINIRTGKYHELKELWEKLNEKVILEYQFKDEFVFETLFTNFLKEQGRNFSISRTRELQKEVIVQDQKMGVKESESLYGQTVYIKTMSYGDFLKQLSRELNIKIKTLHQSFIHVTSLDINKYLNQTAIIEIKQQFENYLLAHAFSDFSIAYQKVNNSIHPTLLTDEKGEVLSDINASSIGRLFSNEKVADNYFFDKMYYDSNLEKENIKNEIAEVIVFTKIPQKSIRIPVAGGKTYSPDFAYVIKHTNNKKILHFVVETKDVVNKDGLRIEEEKKINHAEKLFGNAVKIEFRTQFSNVQIKDLIQEIMSV